MAKLSDIISNFSGLTPEELTTEQEVHPELVQWITAAVQEVKTAIQDNSNSFNTPGFKLRFSPSENLYNWYGQDLWYRYHEIIGNIFLNNNWNVSWDAINRLLGGTTYILVLWK